MRTFSFLPSSQQTLKSIILGILESYENPWDVVAELAQNGLDSVRRIPDRKGHFSLKVNEAASSFVFSDNGTGISPHDAEELFKPYGSNKRSDPNSIGEKGVGLKFVIFSSNHFCLTSHHKEGSFRVSVSAAADWLNAMEDTEILLEFDQIDNPNGEQGVTVELTVNDPNHSLLTLSADQLRWLVLTKTALGSTKHIWSDAENADVMLEIIDKSGKQYIREFECNYLLPTDFVKKSISIDEYDDWRQTGDKSDQQKRSKLKDRVIFNSGSRNSGSREIRFWSCMVPSRTQWFKIGSDAGILQDESQEEFDRETFFYAMHEGVYLSTKSMPTGITIELRASGESGYASNFFMIIEDPSLSFDVGRKGVPPRTSGVLRKIAQDQFRKYLAFKRFLRGESESVDDQFAREDLFQEIFKLPNLDSSESVFLKRPNDQEATVAAIFYELLGKRKFPDFKPYITGYRDKYDLTGKIGSRNLILEFKHSLAGLFNDFGNIRKLFNEINVVVLWEITENDRKKSADRGIDIIPIEDDDESIFPHCQFQLSIPDVSPIEVLEVKGLVL